MIENRQADRREQSIMAVSRHYAICERRKRERRQAEICFVNNWLGKYHGYEKMSASNSENAY